MPPFFSENDLINILLELMFLRYLLGCLCAWSHVHVPMAILLSIAYNGKVVTGCVRSGCGVEVVSTWYRGGWFLGVPAVAFFAA